jgi:hypothetical protein
MYEYTTLAEAKLAALKEQTRRDAAKGRRLSPLARTIIGLDR